MNVLPISDNIQDIELNVPYHVTLENCLVSWGGSLFTPQTPQGKDTPEYSITVFIPNTNPDFIRLARFTSKARSKYPTSNQNKGFTTVDMVQNSPQRLQAIFQTFQASSKNQDESRFLLEECGFTLDIESYSKVIAKTTEPSHIITAGTVDNPITYTEDPKLFYEGSVVSISYYLTFYCSKPVDGQQPQFFSKRTLENVHYVHPGFSKYRDSAPSSFRTTFMNKPRFFKQPRQVPNPQFINPTQTHHVDLDEEVPF